MLRDYALMQGLEFDSQNLKGEGDWDRYRAVESEREKEYEYEYKYEWLRMRELSKFDCRMNLVSARGGGLNIKRHRISFYLWMFKI